MAKANKPPALEGKMRISKLVSHLVLAALMSVGLFGCITNALAQTRTATVQETEDKNKVDLYTRFVDNYKTNPAAAYQTAKDYLQRYAKENDQYSNEKNGSGNCVTWFMTTGISLKHSKSASR